MTVGNTQTQTHAAIEWPTVAIAGTVYVCFGILTWFHAALPWWAIVPCGGYLVCLHGSLQHEAVHGHPTGRRWLDDILVFPSLWLWLPFAIYRESHLTHHRDDQLTCPINDPESYYLLPAAWSRFGPAARAFWYVYNTVLGRLVLGPPFAVARLALAERRRLAEGDRSHLAIWLMHIPACGLVLTWVLVVCGIPFGEYLLLYAYPGLALTLLRSFAEHRAVREVGERSLIVEAGPVMSLLYLNNNLHALHHAQPRLPWYALGPVFREQRREVLAANGGYRFTGYPEVVLRYLLWPKEPASHPFVGLPDATAS